MSLSVSVSLCRSTILSEGERAGGRDEGGGVRGVTRLLRGCGDTGGGREERGGKPLPRPRDLASRRCERPPSLGSFPREKSGSFSFSELQSLRSVISRSESDSGSCFTPFLRSEGLWRPPTPTPPKPRPKPRPRPRPVPGTPGMVSPLSLSLIAPFPSSVRPIGTPGYGGMQSLGGWPPAEPLVPPVCARSAPVVSPGGRREEKGCGSWDRLDCSGLG